jgi:hypothetical protein
MLPFDRAFVLLSDHGLRVVPSIVLAGEERLGALPFPGPYAVKLADVAHRTEILGVRLGLTSQQVGDAVEELRSLAGSLGLSDRVAVQQMVESHGEAFIGLRGSSELGPVVTVGLGGILVQLQDSIAGRIAPIDGAEALELVNELTYTGVFDGLRGDRPWDRGQLAQAVEAASTLVTAGRRWIESLDINPLIFDGEGFVVVDAVCLVADGSRCTGEGQAP